MNTRPLIAFAPLALGLAVAGCTKGSSDGSTAAPTTAALAGTPNTQGHTWTTVRVNQIAGGRVDALAAAPVSTDALAAAYPLREVVRVDGGVAGAPERGFMFHPVALVPAGGELYAATADRHGPGAGDVYRRTATGWDLSLDTPDRELALAALGGDLVAVSGSIDGGAPTVHLASGGGAWQAQPGVITRPCVPSAAAASGNELWIGAGPGSATGSAFLFRGAVANLTEVPLPAGAPGSRQEVTALLPLAQGVAIALGSFDPLSGDPVAGVLLVHDGLELRALTSYAQDAPRALAWHDGTLYVGTAAGRLQRLASGQLVDEPGLPANRGVHALLSLDADTLLLGVEDVDGAAVLVRSLGASPLGGSGSSAPAGAPLDYLIDVKPLLSQACVSCHSTLPSGFNLTAGLADDAADHQAVLAQVDSAVPEASPLLTRVDGTQTHTGGAPWPSTSQAYQTVIQWIADGALLDKSTVAGAGAASPSTPAPSAPAPAPATPTYLVDVKPIMQTCVGCHQNEDPRLSPNLSDDAADYQSILNDVNLGDPASSNLLRRATQQRGHPVKLFDVGSVPYDTILTWIQQGAPFQ